MQSKNKVLIKAMWNKINLSIISKLIDPIDVVFLISNKKLSNPIMLLLSLTKVLSCYNIFSWSNFFIN